MYKDFFSSKNIQSINDHEGLGGGGQGFCDRTEALSLRKLDDGVMLKNRVTTTYLFSILIFLSSV